MILEESVETCVCVAMRLHNASLQRLLKLTLARKFFEIS